MNPDYNNHTFIKAARRIIKKSGHSTDQLTLRVAVENDKQAKTFTSHDKKQIVAMALSHLDDSLPLPLIGTQYPEKTWESLYFVIHNSPVTKRLIQKAEAEFPKLIAEVGSTVVYHILCVHWGHLVKKYGCIIHVSPCLLSWGQ